MAEKEGFEPSEAYASAVFKTAALNHSTISPQVHVLKISPIYRFYKLPEKILFKNRQ